jgi:hypothetical protein
MSFIHSAGIVILKFSFKEFVSQTIIMQFLSSSDFSAVAHNVLSLLIVNDVISFLWREKNFCSFVFKS